MLETYVIARDKFLKRNESGIGRPFSGKMFPGSSDLYIVPFEDAEIYNEQVAKADFW